MMNVQSRTAQFSSNLESALTYPFTSWQRTVSMAVIGVLTYLLLIMSVMPEFTIQMLSAGLHWFDYVVISLTQTTYRSNGWFGLGVIVAYSILTGVALVNTIAQVRMVGVSSVSDLVGIVPGLLASGCASCGAGMLGFLGFAGAMAAMPFHGDLLRVGGLALLLFFLGRAGDPRECTL
nr:MULTISPECIES: hypothetical protein [unclassified Haladaptatus]